VIHEGNVLSVLTVAAASVAAVILLAFLVRRPLLDHASKLWLLVGLGVLPITAALGANVQGYKATQHRAFCGSCHVMIPHAKDSEDPTSTSLAAIHARNAHFGKDSCYTCHADYGMYGTVVTKLGGMRHVWLYATEFHGMSLEEAKDKIHILKPFPNATCLHCHTAEAPRWNKIPDHVSARADVLAGKVGCSSRGCHGAAHPLTKSDAPPRPPATEDHGSP